MTLTELALAWTRRQRYIARLHANEQARSLSGPEPKEKALPGWMALREMGIPEP